LVTLSRTPMVPTKHTFSVSYKDKNATRKYELEKKWLCELDL
jgi:hypothetical protein